MRSMPIKCPEAPLPQAPPDTDDEVHHNRSFRKPVTCYFLCIESRESQETTRKNRPFADAIDIFGPSDEVRFDAMASQHRTSHEV